MNILPPDVAVATKKDRPAAVFDESVVGIRKQGHGSGTLDGNCKCALMLCAVAGDTTRQNLAALGHILSQAIAVLVIDVIDFIHAELADFLAGTSGMFSSWHIYSGSFPGINLCEQTNVKREDLHR